MAGRETTRALGAKPTTAVAVSARRAAVNFIVESVCVVSTICDGSVPFGARALTTMTVDEVMEVAVAMDGERHGGRISYTWHSLVRQTF